MNTVKLLSAVAITAGVVATSQAVMAYSAGDIFVRGGVAKTEVASDNGRVDVAGDLDVSDERGLTYGVGVLVHDKVGLELSGQEKVEHDLSGDIGALGSVNRLPFNLMVNYYPMGGLDSRVQPYIGAGLNYTRFTGETLSGLDVDNSYGAVGQLGIDLAITHNFMLNGFVNYADVGPDVSLEGAGDLGSAKVDPMTIGGGATFRF
ncbi:outer membrane beta-barrel protein [Halomonas sp. TRM85114]|uniref:OmpW/AlkL family protein n=1 Tax=Halomonas jincaotanensis TaxID=2810616 RepID=UPI001BD3C39F|nr:OmpW family outer membrane protein [Halomonas jincaotanensis]MBS9405109.1 outer membrane beta-barrel protein [Halomonas jincaotanensis]